MPRQTLPCRGTGTMRCSEPRIKDRPVRMPVLALHHLSLTVMGALSISFLSAKLLSPQEGNRMFKGRGGSPRHFTCASKIAFPGTKMRNNLFHFYIHSFSKQDFSIIFPLKTFNSDTDFLEWWVEI